MQKHIHIISYKEAKRLGMTKFFTGLPCKHGHVSEKYTNSSRWCCDCAKISRAAQHKKYGGKSSPSAARWRKANREKHLENNKRWNEANRRRISAIEADRRKNDIGYKIKKQCHNMIHRTLRMVGTKKKSKTETLLGYSKEDLISHLESKFEPGMTWDNFGRGPGFWNIDHIKPISLFVAEGEKDPAVIDALSNLQPLWFEDNSAKSKKYEEV